MRVKQRNKSQYRIKGTSDTPRFSQDQCQMETKERSISYLLLSSTDQEWLYSVERREPSYTVGGNVN